jgi:hypothetical protein
VKAGLDEIENLLTNEGKAPQSWRDGWRTACTNGADEPNCISPSKVASFLDHGSDFVRAINATEAFQVASGDFSLDLRPELMRAADRPMPSPGAHHLVASCHSYPPFKERAIRPDQETYPGATLRVDPAVELVDWLLGRVPPHGVPSITMEGIENSDRVKSLLTELVTTSAGMVIEIS